MAQRPTEFQPWAGDPAGNLAKEMAKGFGQEIGRQVYQDFKTFLSRVWSLGHKPRLVLFVNEHLTYREVEVLIENGRGALFGHVMVVNTSPNHAAQCVGTLMDIHRRLPSGVWAKEREYTDQLPLTWAHQDDDRPVVIDGWGYKLLDLCYTVEGTEDMQFVVSRRAHGLRTRFGPGFYRATLRVTALPNVSEPGTILVIHGKEWKDLSLRVEPEGENLRIDTLLSPGRFQEIMKAAEDYTPTAVQSGGGRMSPTTAPGILRRVPARLTILTNLLVCQTPKVCCC